MNGIDRGGAIFEVNGYTVFESVVSAQRCDALIDALPQVDTSGSRRLLSRDDFRQTARNLRRHPSLAQILDGRVAIQCIYFRKSHDRNWSIRLHRDDLLPIDGYGPWPDAGTKEGMQYSRPDRGFLEECVAVRLHLDGAPEGDLSVVACSHNDENHYEPCNAQTVIVERGGVLVMRPTIAHASMKLDKALQRRVLHYVFAPLELPRGYRWYEAV